MTQLNSLLCRSISFYFPMQELSRSVQLHEKVRARELKEKNEKYKKAVDEMRRLENDHRELLAKFRVSLLKCKVELTPVRYLTFICIKHKRKIRVG